jgi:nicotinamidase-related amidase
MATAPTRPDNRRRGNGCQIGWILAGGNDALLVIDMQKGFDDPCWGRRNNPYAECHGLRVLDHWRKAGRQVVVVRHDSAHPGSPLRPGPHGNAMKPGFEPRDGEWLITKQVNSAFIGTSLEARLRGAGITGVTLFGITTDQCVSTTARMASNLGFATTLVEDACACFDQVAFDGRRMRAETLHRAHVTTLLTEFARVATADELIHA